MGYSEARCTICGVSFNIGRVRRPNEPWDAAWAEYGFSNVCTYAGGCKKSAGCTFRNVPAEELEMRAQRETGELPEYVIARFLKEVVLEKEGARGKAEGLEGGEKAWLKRALARVQGMVEEMETGGDGGEEDQGGVVEQQEADDSGDEANEGADAVDSENNMGENPEVEADDARAEAGILELAEEAGDDDNENGEDAMNIDQDPDNEAENEKQEHGAQNENADTESDMSECGEGYDREAEHIAGPGCKHTSGYRGHDISVEELFFSRTVQVLCRKLPKDYEPIFAGREGGPFNPEPDDQPFELKSDFFLSGLSDNPGEREMGGPDEFYPTRHGAERPQGENIAWDNDIEEQCPVFHPSCFEMYKILSSARLGYIDIEGFMCRWILECDNNDRFYLFKDPNVKLNDEQFWVHEPGTEYLAANPLYMSTLNEIFKASIVPESDTTFNIRNGAFDLAGEADPLRENPSDPFNVLPNELRQHISSYLSSKEIAPLRLASRSYRQLPISVFYRLLRRERPSLFEIVPETPPLSKWTKNRARDLKMEGVMIDKGRKAMRRFLMEEWKSGVDVKGIMAEWQDEKIKAWLGEKEHRPPVEDIRLERERTNWFKLYTLMSRAERKGELKGLRNRERIWADCERILKKVAKYRVEGRIPFTKSLAEIVNER